MPLPSAAIIQLLDPLGSAVAAQGIDQSGGETAEFFSVPAPMPGVWHLVVSASGNPVAVNYHILGVPGTATVVAGLGSVYGESITGPTPLILEARLSLGLGVAGASVSGTALEPDGSEVPVTFADDGVGPDRVAGDGIYSARFLYTQNGLYNFTVHFNNDQGRAALTYAGLALTPRTDGTIPPVPPVGGPVGFNFNRSASLQLAVSNAPIIACPDNFVTPADPRQCSAVVNYSVATAPGVSASCTPPSGSAFPKGTTTVTCSASGASNSCSFKATVQDTTPPTIGTVTARPNVLWPPNHKMVPVTIVAPVSDNCDAAPVCKIAAVSSNEPINGLGDGDTSPDWQITGNLAVKLRSERAATGTGREYTLTIQCTDASKNSTTRLVSVTVSQRLGN